MKDLTKQEAERWVEQELAKATDSAKITYRLDTEERMIAFAKQMKDPLPNSLWAHEELHRRLTLRQGF